MTKTIATIVGILTASVIPVAIFALMGRDEYTLGLLPIFYCFSAMATLLFGVPAFFLLRRFKLIRWWSALMVGFASGAIVAAIVGFPAVDEILFMSFIGAISAFAFWLIWKLGRDESKSHGVIS